MVGVCEFYLSKTVKNAYYPYTRPEVMKPKYVPHSPGECVEALIAGPPPMVSDPIGLGWGLRIWTSSWGLLLLRAWEPLFEDQCIDTLNNGKGCFFCFPQYGSRNHTNAQFSTNRLMRRHYDKEGGSNKHSSSDHTTAQAAVTFYWSLLCNYVTMYSVMCFDDHLM